MTNTPRPMQVVRPRTGVARGDHGTFTDPVAPQSERPAAGSSRPDPDVSESTTADLRAAGSRTTSTAASSKANYDARGKIIWRGVDDETYGKLRAMYREQLRREDGIDGWSEWGRYVLQRMVAEYETRHGELDPTAHVALRSGRPPRMPR
jgi:hypothetical protein